jgi:succinyl-diaminopimelate desuccinylase
MQDVTSGEAIPDETADAVVELARELIAIDTANPPGAELDAARHVAAYLKAAGLAVTLQPFGERRANVVARIGGKRERPSLVFTGHLDTVPIGPREWTRPPLSGVVDDGRLYGRGAVDMKGSVAAMAVALGELSRRADEPAGDIVLAITAGEETDSCGAERLAASGLLDDAGMMVVGEPTDFDVGIAHRGALWLRVEATGERGHGSRPVRDKNAICRLLEWLQPLDELEGLVTKVEHPLLGTGSLSLNMFVAGDAPNVIPDVATATLDFRTLPGQSHDEIIAALEERRPETRVMVLRDAPPVAVDAASALARAAVEAVKHATGRAARIRGLPYVTDASAFVAALGVPAVVVGPGQEAQAHTVDEYVDVRALAQAVALYAHMGQSMYTTP